MSVTAQTAVAARPRAFVRVAGPDAAEFLQRMVSNDVAALAAGEACDALLLTAKARVIAPLRVLRRADDDFLLLTEPDLGERVRSELLRFRFAARTAIEPEEHTSFVVFGREEGIATTDYGEPAVEVLDEPLQATLGEDELERRRIDAGTPAWGREIDDRVLPAEAGLDATHISFSKGCYPGQEPIARLRYRGRANRSLRRVELGGDALPDYDAELREGDRVVGRITSAARAGDGRIVALAYVRREIGDDAELTTGGVSARLLR